MFDNDVAGREVGHIIYIIGRCAVACRNGLLWFMLDMCELSEFYLHFNRRTHIFAKTLKSSPAMIGKRIKSFSGTAPASKSASLPGILWPPVSDRDSMTAIQAFTIQTPYEYCGNYEYIRGKLSRINTPTGYYENGRHYFYVKDYQGNVRCTVSDNDSLTKAVHYYPGGSLFGESYGYYFWSGNNLFQGGKLEKSNAHTFYDLQNRHYDPILNRFTSVDALGEKSQRVSHYIYALGNPVKFIDPDGLEPTPYEGGLMCWAVYQDKKFEDIIKILEKLNWYISNKDFNIQMNHPANTGIGMQSMVFEKRKGDEVIEYAYVYAGTNSLEDVVEDITQTIGFSPQVNAAVKNAKIMEDNVDGKELTFLGHSLGGSLAAASSMATGKKAITYNPAAISRASRLLHGLIDDNKIVNYISVGINFMGRSATIDPITYIQNELGIYAPGMNYCVQVGLQWPWNYHSIEVLTKALK